MLQNESYPLLKCEHTIHGRNFQKLFWILNWGYNLMHILCGQWDTHLISIIKVTVSVICHRYNIRVKQTLLCLIGFVRVLMLATYIIWIRYTMKVEKKFSSQPGSYSWNWVLASFEIHSCKLSLQDIKQLIISKKIKTGRTA